MRNAVFHHDLCGSYLYRSNIRDPWQVLRNYDMENEEEFEEEIRYWRQNSSYEIERVFAWDSYFLGYALIVTGDYEELKARFSGWDIWEI